MSDPKLPESPERILREEDVGDEDALAAAREETITLLSECFARDVLTVEDFERRAGLVHGARSMEELGAAIEGIRTGGSIAPPRGAADLVPAGEDDRADYAIAVFGETKRVGKWVPARRTTTVAVAGSVVVDLREAALGPGQTVISAFTFMGAVEVIVPPGVTLQCSGSSIFGAFEQSPEFAPATTVPGAPQLRVDGFAVFGSVEVERRLPGESKRDARRRRRREKRAQKRLRR